MSQRGGERMEKKEGRGGVMSGDAERRRRKEEETDKNNLRWRFWRVSQNTSVSIDTSPVFILFGKKPNTFCFLLQRNQSSGRMNNFLFVSSIFYLFISFNPISSKHEIMILLQITGRGHIPLRRYLCCYFFYHFSSILFSFNERAASSLLSTRQP